MATKNISVTLITSPFIISYPHLVNPVPFMENGKPKGNPMYSFEAISEPDSLNEWQEVNRETGDFDTVNVEKRLLALAKERFGEDFSVKEAVKHGGFSWPFKSGDARADEKGDRAEIYRGKRFWRAKAMAEIGGKPNTPDLWTVTGDGGVERIVRGTTGGDQQANQLFYPGAICTAELNASCGETAQGKYITFYVNAVVFQSDGQRLGGSSNIQRMYANRGGEAQVDPTAGMGTELDDDIPF